MPHFRNSVPQELLDSALPGNDTPTESHRATTSAVEFTSSAGGEVIERTSSRASSIRDLLNPPSSLESQTTATFDPPLAEKDGSQSSQSSALASTQDSLVLKAEEQKDEGTVAEPIGKILKPSPNGVKRAYDEMSGQRNAASEANASSQVPSLPSQSSNVRLSMSLDGAVKVKTNDEETPSPPKQRIAAPTFGSKARGGLQRSKSALISSDSLVEGSAPKQKPKAIGGLFGRSRDARTWEFYADGDAREALSSHAESERTGSAAGAISLIRSQSQKARLNVITERVDGSNARKQQLSQDGGKPKLSRAKSSMGRLQDVDSSFVKPAGKDKPCGRVQSPSGDSDKENWEPGTRSSNNPLRRQHASSNRQPVMNDHDCASSQLAGRTGNLAAGRKRNNIGKQRSAFNKANDENDEENAALGGEGGKGEDLDCIQGLLSLSQGAWQ